MNHTRIFTLAGRVIRQIIRDHRTMALFLLGPLVVFTLAMLLFRAEASPMPVGIVNEDEGASVLLVGEIRLADRIVEEMENSGSLLPLTLNEDAADAALREGRVYGVLQFPADFTSTFASQRHSNLQLTLEGSDPIQSMALSGSLMQSAMRAMAGLAAGMMPGAGGELPVNLDVSYVYGGPEFDMLDYYTAPFLAIIVFFFVFLLTTVSFLRERSQGTIERLMATPATRLEIVVGYMLGFLSFALVEAGLLLVFTVVVVKIHYTGNLLNVFLIEGLLVVVAVNLGIFLSTFARNEFQVVQFIPIVIFPMILLSGMFWSVDSLPGLLKPIALALPLTHANTAMRDIMIKGWSLGAVGPQLLALAAIGAIVLLLAAATIRKEIA